MFLTEGGGRKVGENKLLTQKKNRFVYMELYNLGLPLATPLGHKVCDLPLTYFYHFDRFTPYSQFEKCRICKTTVHQPHSKYCQGCAYKKGMKVFDYIHIGRHCYWYDIPQYSLFVIILF